MMEEISGKLKRIMQTESTIRNPGNGIKKIERTRQRERGKNLKCVKR